MIVIVPVNVLSLGGEGATQSAEISVSLLIICENNNIDRTMKEKERRGETRENERRTERKGERREEREGKEGKESKERKERRRKVPCSNTVTNKFKPPVGPCWWLA